MTNLFRHHVGLRRTWKASAECASFWRIVLPSRLDSGQLAGGFGRRPLPIPIRGFPPSAPLCGVAAVWRGDALLPIRPAILSCSSAHRVLKRGGYVRHRGEHSIHNPSNDDPNLLGARQGVRPSVCVSILVHADMVNEEEFAGEQESFAGAQNE